MYLCRGGIGNGMFHFVLYFYLFFLLSLDLLRQLGFLAIHFEIENHVLQENL